jgi:DNA-binding NarL/FixJ family response regulator
MKRLRVLLAEDHGVVRAGLAALIRSEPDLEVIAEVANGEEAIRQIEALRPEVSVVDVGMPQMTGIELARAVRDAGLPTAVVLLSMHSEPSFVRAGLEAGASAYVLKSARGRDLVDAMHAAANGDIYLSPAVAGAVVFPQGEAVRPELTARERDVLRLLARGLCSKEIAAELEISTRTVDGYRAQIMDKLGIRNVPGLVKYALRCHLTTLDE